MRLVLKKDRLVSLNDLLGMNHWQRHKHRKQVQNAVLSELLLAGSTCSTKTTCMAGQNHTSIPSVIAEQFARTLQTRLNSKSSRKKSPTTNSKKP